MTRPRLPKTVNIIGQQYHVRRVPKLLSEDGTERLNGEINDNTLILRLDKGLKRCKEQEMLLHEIMHGCFYEVPGIEGETEEKFVAALSHRLLKVIKDNPDLVEYLRS